MPGNTDSALENFMHNHTLLVKGNSVMIVNRVPDNTNSAVDCLQ